MDLTEAEDHYVLKADLPGVNDEDVKIEVENGLLTISGERKEEHERAERSFYRVERAFGRFQRQLTMPEGIDPDGVTAEFDRGVLSVRIPKPEQVKPRRVAIGTSGNGRPSNHRRHNQRQQLTPSPRPSSAGHRAGARCWTPLWLQRRRGLHRWASASGLPRHARTERVGFEPTRQVNPAHAISSRAP